MTTALVLDDQVAYIRALERSLRREAELIAAQDVATARAATRAEVSVALVDICLSQADTSNQEGLEFIRWLRTERPDMKIIAMSARDDTDLPAKAKDAGADTFLPKPLRISELKRILADLDKASA